MAILRNFLAHAACGSLLAAGFGGQVLPASAQQAGGAASSQTAAGASSEVNGSQNLPDSPGTILARAAFPEQSSQAAPIQVQTNQTEASQNQSNQSQSANQPQTQKPVGTAAAEAPSTSGVAASEPAGVAIAPAKQRRARTIIIRTGAIIGAAVAVGVVVGLTAATGPKPPGAH